MTPVERPLAGDSLAIMKIASRLRSTAAALVAHDADRSRLAAMPMTAEIDPVDALRAAAVHLRARAEEMRSATPGGRKSLDLSRAAAQCEREAAHELMRRALAQKTGAP